MLLKDITVLNTSLFICGFSATPWTVFFEDMIAVVLSIEEAVVAVL